MADVQDDRARESHLREVERAMLYIAEARLKADVVADALEKDGADARHVTALRDAAEALRAEHNRLLSRTHFHVPEDELAETRERNEPQELDEHQQRMAV
jgi:hypothetical protein